MKVVILNSIRSYLAKLIESNPEGAHNMAEMAAHELGIANQDYLLHLDYEQYTRAIFNYINAKLYINPELLFTNIFESIGLKRTDIKNIPKSNIEGWNELLLMKVAQSLNVDNNDKELKNIMRAAFDKKTFKKIITESSSTWGTTNLNTKRQFENLGLNWEKWLNPPNLQVKTNYSSMQQSLLENRLFVFENYIEELRNINPKLKSHIDKVLKSDIQKDGSFKVLKTIKSSSTIAVNYIDEVLTKLIKVQNRAQENSKVGAETIRNRAIKTQDLFKNIRKLKTDIKDECGEDILDCTIKIWDRIPKKDLFQGNYSTCCIRIGGTHQESMYQYLTNTAFNMIEIVDNKSGNVIGNSLIYLIKDKNDKLRMILDNIEINNHYRFVNAQEMNLLDKIAEFAIKYSSEVLNKPQSKAYIGSLNNDLPIELIDTVELGNWPTPIMVREIEGSIVGDITDKKIYLDAIGGFSANKEYLQNAIFKFYPINPNM